MQSWVSNPRLNPRPVPVTTPRLSWEVSTVSSQLMEQRSSSSTGVTQPSPIPSLGTAGKESACQSRRRKRCGFDPWVRKISRIRKCQPTPAFRREFHGQRGLAGSSPWGPREPGTTEHARARTHVYCRSPGGGEVGGRERAWRSPGVFLVDRSSPVRTLGASGEGGGGLGSHPLPLRTPGHLCSSGQIPNSPLTVSP